MNPQASALLTDLYQLIMLQAYIEHSMEQTAVFEFFMRKLPPNRCFLMAAGLAQVLEYLESPPFETWELEWLDRSGRFSNDFIDYLSVEAITCTVSSRGRRRHWNERISNSISIARPFVVRKIIEQSP
jgi:nicotinate phosphoribosyltransferase